MKKGLPLDSYLDLMRQGVVDMTLCLDNVDYAKFLDSRVLQLAVVKVIENLGETAGDVLDDYPDFAAGNQEIRWRAWKNARNKLCHAYHGIDYLLVWNMATVDVPKLDRALAAMAEQDLLNALSMMSSRGTGR